MNHLKLYEDMGNEKVYDILFTPSGEMIEINTDEFDELSEYIIINYNEEFESWIIGDDHREIVTYILKN